jgi:hypothetical protein
MTIIEQPDMPTSETNHGMNEEFAERPWIDLKTSYDVEAWIDNYNRELQRHIKDPKASGYGICFRLHHGGEIYLHTNAEVILLDVTPEAEWVTPVISAATEIQAPHAQIWALPEDRLTQLVLGLGNLIASSRIVLCHNYKAKKNW